ncbi:MAG: hypothetical protein DMG13_05520 [Acidobacteria bacterium]|nr:MAG: hypothetical protein DMG13_05520 [Acidobacteriota bacterium]
MAAMWLGPVLYVGVSVFLWKYAGWVFMPLLVTRSVLRWLPVLTDLETVILINTSLLYFSVYFVFAIFWARLKLHFRNPFIAGAALWLVNVLILFPMLGRGVLGYRLPQGWISASLPLLVTHWIFARGLQFQQKR